MMPTVLFLPRWIFWVWNSWIQFLILTLPKLDLLGSESVYNEEFMRRLDEIYDAVAYDEDSE